MRVVALFRVSTEKQAAEGASLDAQQRAYREMAQRSGWTTAAEFRGHESATQAATDRKVLQVVLAFIRDEGADAIYVHEQSRLTRGDELEVALLMRELKERGIKIVVGGVVRDLSSIDERFMVGIQGLVDRAESERIKERLNRGKRQRAMQGRKTGGPAPLGYRNPRPGEPGRGTLVVVPDEAETVRRAFELAAGGLGPRRTADELNRAGLRTRTGRRWGKSSVSRLLHNVAYIGTSAAGVWVRGPSSAGSKRFRLDLSNPRAVLRENAHEAIVSPELWAMVNGRTGIPRTPKPRALTNLLWVNGHAYGGDSTKAGSYYRSAHRGAGLPWLPSEETDARVWAAFAGLATSPEYVDRLLASADNRREAGRAQQRARALESEAAKAKRRSDTLLEMRLNGEIDGPTYAARAAEARERERALERELESVRAQARAFESATGATVARAVRVLLSGHRVLTVAQKRQIMRTLVRRVDVEAVPLEKGFKRDARGRVLPGQAARWGVGSIRFTLDADAARAATSGDLAAHGGGGAGAGEPSGRSGQLGTTCLGGGPLSEAEESLRAGHKGTTH